jgi:hypothetical protein
MKKIIATGSSLAMVVLLLIVGITYAADTEEILVDSRSATPTSGVVTLTNGITYTINIKGTISYWSASKWMSGFVGEPDSSPIFPSSGIENIYVGTDLFFVYAYPTAYPDYCATLPCQRVSLQISIDDGNNWIEIEPQEYNVFHSYDIKITGQGFPIKAIVPDNKYSDNYGQYRLRIMQPALCIDTDGDGVIDEWDTCPNTPAGSWVNKDGCPASGLYTQEQVNKMVKDILTWGDTNGDNKIGLEEAIKALQTASGIGVPAVR